jgi:hypothetical protein
VMVTIGVDPHKQTHSGVAVDPLGVRVAQRTVACPACGVWSAAGVGSLAGLRAGVGDRGCPARVGVLGAVLDRSR